MDHKVKFSLLAIALLLGSVLGMYVIAQAAPLDPLAEFRIEDGRLSIPGGKFTPELQALLFPVKSPDTYWTYAPVRSAYATLAIQGTERDIPRAERSDPQPLKPIGTDSFKVFFDALLKLPRDIVSFFQSISPVGTAAAVNRFAVFDDAQCTTTTVVADADCWSTTTNGDGNGAPAAGDDLVFDNGSGAVSGTMEGNLNVTTGTIVFCSAAASPDADCGGVWANTLSIVTFTLTNTGTWQHAAGTISISTGAIDGGAATWSGGTMSISGAGALTWDGLTISAGTLAKAGATLTVQGGLTMSGGDLTSTSGVSSVTGNVNISSVASAIDFGSEAWTVSGTWTNASTDASWDAGTGSMAFTSATGGTMTFAGANLSESEFNSPNFNSSGGASQTFTMATRGLQYGTSPGASVLTVQSATVLDKATFTLDGGVNGDIEIVDTSSITSTSGAVTVRNVTIGAAGAFIDLGSEAWTVSGSWDNSTTTASWDAGTGTVTFNSATGGTMTFAGANLAEDEFSNVTFSSTAGAPQTFTLDLRGLRLGGTLTVSDGSSTTTLDTSGSNLAITASAVTIGTGGILTANASTITVSGNWTLTGTFTAGTSTIVFSGNGDIISATAFYNMTVNISTSRTTGTGNIAHAVDSVLTVNGTLDLTGNDAFRVFDLRNPVSTSNPLVMGASGVITSSEAEGGGPNDSIISFANLSAGANNPATVNIPAGIYYNIALELLARPAGTTFVATGNWATNVNPETGTSNLGVYIWVQGTNSPILNLNSRTVAVSGIQETVAGTFGITATTATVNLIAANGGYLNQALGGGGVGFGICDCPMTAGFYISFGSSTWNVEGDWSSESTSASWSAGTGTVNFVGTGDGTVQDIGDSGGNKNLFGTITMSGENKLIWVTDFSFTSWSLVGATTMTMDGIAVSGMQMSADAGTIALTDWTAFSTAGAGTSVTWTFNPSAAGATVTITLGGLVSGSRYDLNRDGNLVDFEEASGDSVTFAVTAGWSSHVMQITRPSVGGGTPPPETPTTPPPVEVPLSAHIPTASLAAILLGALLLMIGNGVKARRLELIGLILMALGILGLAYIYGYLF